MRGWYLSFTEILEGIVVDVIVEIECVVKKDMVFLKCTARFPLVICPYPYVLDEQLPFSDNKRAEHTPFGVTRFVNIGSVYNFAYTWSHQW